MSYFFLFCIKIFENCKWNKMYLIFYWFKIVNLFIWYILVIWIKMLNCCWVICFVISFFFIKWFFRYGIKFFVCDLEMIFSVIIIRGLVFLFMKWCLNMNFKVFGVNNYNRNEVKLLIKFYLYFFIIRLINWILFYKL